MYSQPVIYCGPGSPKLGIRKFQVFRDQLSPIMLEAVAKVPEIEKLIVPYTELTDMRMKIGTKGSPENLYYEIIEGKLF